MLILPFTALQFGLGYDTISVLHTVPPFYKMMEKGMLDEPVFAFYLGSAEGTKADPNGGEVVFGGVDKAHYEGEIFYAPVRRRGYWEVELKSVKFGDEEMKLHNVGAAIDTGKCLARVSNPTTSPFFHILICDLAMLTLATHDRYFAHCSSHRHCRDHQRRDWRYEELVWTIHGGLWTYS